MTKSPQALYKEREQRVLDALMLKKSDRVPAIVLFGWFASRYARISRKDEIYDLEKSYEANLKATLAFKPDMASAPLTFGTVLETLDYKQLQWSGYGLPDDYGYQYVEGEYMKPEDYEAFLALWGITAKRNQVHSTRLPSGCALHFAWVQGEGRYLRK